MPSTIEAAFRQLLEAVVQEVAEKLRREHEIHEKASLQQVSHVADPLLLDSVEAAKRLGISKATLERWTRSGTIPFLKLGRLVRFNTQTLQQWISESESNGKQRANKNATAGVIHK